MSGGRGSIRRRTRATIDSDDVEEQPFDLFGANGARGSYRSDASPPSRRRTHHHRSHARSDASPRARTSPRAQQRRGHEQLGPSFSERRATRHSSAALSPGNDEPAPQKLTRSAEQQSRVKPLELPCQSGCGFVCDNPVKLAEHNRVCTYVVSGTGFVCERGCGFESEFQAVVEDHEERCRFIVTYQCENGCGYSTKTESELDRHKGDCIMKGSPMKLRRGDGDDEDGEYECVHDCGFTSSVKQKVITHERTCERAEMFECEKGCGYNHRNQRTVEIHETTCTHADMMFECERGCGFESRSERTVERHERLCEAVPRAVPRAGNRSRMRSQGDDEDSDDDDDDDDDDAPPAKRARSLRDRSQLQKPETMNMTIMGGEKYGKRPGVGARGPSNPYNERERTVPHRRRSGGGGRHRRRGCDRDRSEEDSSEDSDAFEVRERRRRRQWDSKRLSSAGLGAKRGAVNSKEDASSLDIDKSVSWKSIGGLDKHIEALHEMVLLPMLYPEVFSRFGVNPPRGVMFYGPPGTGKTMMARALANACASTGQQVAFFMRKGSDCLSKWVGEAERQLRILFEEAKRQQPSIIFFDEV